MININPEKYNSKNILSKEELRLVLDNLKKQGKKIGLCTGSFDLLHPGHLTHLNSAKKCCDVLVVGVAEDKFSTSKNSNSGKPVFSENLRAFMVSQLKPVDFVYIDDCSADNVLVAKPDFFIKGPDYADEKHPRIPYQKQLLASFGGKLVYSDDEKLSTTEIIKYIKENIKD